jgi:Transcriptional regulators
MAGVSTGTVDRILHSRGKVSSDAREKVEIVLKEIDYQPNKIARSLALKKEHHIITLTPCFKEGEYWDSLSKGIDVAEKELLNYNVTVERWYFDQYDKNSFDSLIPRFKEVDCQGVVIATLFRESALVLIKQLDELSIPYVLIDAYIEDTNSIAYYGTPSYNSGRIAGRLLLGQANTGDDIVIFRFYRVNDVLSTQVQMRENGFRDYLSEMDYKGKVHVVKIHSDDVDNNKSLLDSFFQENPDVGLGVIFNSRAYLLGDYITENQQHRFFRLVGYDAIQANINYLKENLITHLIAQRPEVQGLNCIKALFRHLVLQEENTAVNYMPLDVLMKENIDFYNNYI